MKKLLTYIVIVGSLFFISCEKEEIKIQKNSEPELQNLNISDGMIELTDPLTNPYSVKNMLFAYNDLKLKGNNLKESIEIKPTHYYVRFLPKDFDELDLLERDSILILFDYPLDRKIKKGGTYYRDPTLPLTQKITWQYTIVPIDYKFPNIKFEIIEKLFLNQELNKIKNYSNIYEKIEAQSLKLTGNYNDSLMSSKKLKSSWRPSGIITVSDNHLGQVPVTGAKVRAKNWFRFDEVLTNNKGEFITESFNYDVDYSIKWERADFDIRSGDWGQAYYQGPNDSNSSWILNITGGMSFVYAQVHRAAISYWYENKWGIKTPPKDSFWKRKVKIGCYDKADRAFINVAARWTTFPEIYIYQSDLSGNLKSGKQLFKTAIHELAHSSHWDLSNWHYNNADDKVVESWAVGVAYVITNSIYGGTEDSWQWVTLNHIRTTYEGKYTPLVIDLIDNYNQNTSLKLDCLCGNYDGANCFVGTPPSGTSAFIYNNKFYYSPVNGNQCPMVGSNFDGANCFVKNIPYNTTGFIYNNSWFVQEQGLPIDRVGGYTLKQIENALTNVTSLDAWKNNIREQNINSSEDFLNELFNNFINL